MRGRDKFRKYKPALDKVSMIYGHLPAKVRSSLMIHTRNVKGLPGMANRYALVKSLSPMCGDNVSIHESFYFTDLKKITFGSNVSIQPMCSFIGPGWIKIGNDVSIAHGVSFISGEHNFDSLEENIKDQGVEEKDITIGDNVWIGAKATILGGVTIGAGSIIAAGSVVTKDVEPFSVVAGVPAKVIRRRS